MAFGLPQHLSAGQVDAPALWAVVVVLIVVTGIIMLAAIAARKALGAVVALRGEITGADALVAENAKTLPVLIGEDDKKVNANNEESNQIENEGAVHSKRLPFSSSSSPEKNNEGQNASQNIESQQGHYPNFANFDKRAATTRNTSVIPTPMMKVSQGTSPETLGTNTPTTKEPNNIFAPSRKKLTKMLSPSLPTIRLYFSILTGFVKVFMRFLGLRVQRPGNGFSLDLTMTFSGSELKWCNGIILRALRPAPSPLYRHFSRYSFARLLRGLLRPSVLRYAIFASGLLLFCLNSGLAGAEEGIKSIWFPAKEDVLSLPHLIIKNLLLCPVYFLAAVLGGIFTIQAYRGRVGQKLRKLESEMALISSAVLAFLFGFFIETLGMVFRYLILYKHYFTAPSLIKKFLGGSLVDVGFVIIWGALILIIVSVCFIPSSLNRGKIRRSFIKKPFYYVVSIMIGWEFVTMFLNSIIPATKRLTGFTGDSSDVLSFILGGTIGILFVNVLAKLFAKKSSLARPAFSLFKKILAGTGFIALLAIAVNADEAVTEFAAVATHAQAPAHAGWLAAAGAFIAAQGTAGGNNNQGGHNKSR